MKRKKYGYYHTAIMVLFAMMILTGCASQKPVVHPNLPTEEAPAWIMKVPVSPDTLFATGVATEHGSIPIVRKNAANAARVEMAQVIETKVKALFDAFLKEHADLLNPEAPTSSEEFSRMVTRLATDAILVGAQIKEYWWDRKEHLYYALSFIPKESLAAEIKGQTEELIKKQKAAIAEENLDEALERMDKALKNWDVNQ